MRKIFISLLSMLTLGISGVWAEDAGDTIYYSNDYSTNVCWATATSGRYTPILQDGYMTVNADQRNNNGTTLTSTEASGKVLNSDGNFTLSCKVKLGASNNQTATAFQIMDSQNSVAILKLSEGATYATQWLINDTQLKATVSAGGNKLISDLSWIYIQVTYKDSKIYLTLKNESGNVIDGYDKTIFSTTSKGGVGKMQFITSRYSSNFAMDSLVVRSVNATDLPSVTYYDYTVKYQCDGTDIKDATIGSDVAGASISLTDEQKANIKTNDKKYIYVSDNSEGKTVSADGTTVVIVTYREAANYTYSVKSSFGTTLASGNFFEGDNAVVSWSKYLNVDGKWYVADVAGKTYTESIDEVIDYKESEIDNFFEAENILSKTYGTLTGIYSGGVTAGVYNGANLTMSGIKSGIYTVTVNTSVRRSGDDKFTVQTSADGSEWADAGTLDLTTNVPGDFSLEGISLTADASYIRLVEANAANQYHYVDYVTLTKTGEIPTTVTKQYANNGTICFEYGADILETSTAKVYMFEGIYEGNVYGLEVTSLEPGMPYIVLAGNLNLSYAKENAAVEGQNCNGLIGVLAGEETTVKGKDYMIFVGGDIYYASDEGNTVSAGHAYFDVAQIPAGKPQTQEAKALFGFNFDTPTGINAVNALKNDAPVYNIAGQLVSKAQNGIFIVNGKKVVVK